MKLVCYDPHARRTDIANAVAEFPHVEFSRPTDLAELATALENAEILVTSNRAYEADAAGVIRQTDELRWIQFTTSGLDKAIGLGLPPGCVVTNAAGLRAFCVAEHAVFLMLSLLRQARMAEQGQRDQRWVRDAITPRLDNLAGKHLLIIGVGAIGQEIARKAKAFDMRVTGISRATAAPPHFDALRPRAELPDAVAGADLIVMAANYEADTHQLMSAALIDAMKPSACFVNIGRGGLVDEEALVAALQEDRIACRRARRRQDRAAAGGTCALRPAQCHPHAPYSRRGFGGDRRRHGPHRRRQSPALAEGRNVAEDRHRADRMSDEVRPTPERQVASPSYRIAALDQDFLLRGCAARRSLHARIREARAGAARLGRPFDRRGVRLGADPRGRRRAAGALVCAGARLRRPVFRARAALWRRGKASATTSSPPAAARAIMEAANRGAADAGAPTIGFNIALPHEQVAQPLTRRRT